MVEIDPSQGEKGLQWHLLTSLPVSSAEEAEAKVSRYRQRWKVEDFFRVLKSGCKVQDQRFRTAERPRKAVAIQGVIAWRVMVMTLLGRKVPECAAEVLFAKEELEFLKPTPRIRAGRGRATRGRRWRWWPTWEATGDASTIGRRGTRSCGKDATD